MKKHVLACVSAVILVTAAHEPIVLCKPTYRQDKKARAMYSAGELEYAAGSYGKATVLFLGAYRLTEYSELLFNIANCYERMGNYKMATRYLRHYLESNDAEDVNSVRRRIRRLERAMARPDDSEMKSDLRDSSPKSEITTAVPAKPSANVVSEMRSESSSVYWWLGGGAIALTSGIAFSLAKRAASSSVRDRCMNGVCLESALPFVKRERRFAIAADVSFGVTLVTAVVATWSFLGQTPATMEVAGGTIHPIVMDTGIGVGFSSEL